MDETEELAQGCGKFVFVVFVIVLCLIITVFLLGKHY